MIVESDLSTSLKFNSVYIPLLNETNISFSKEEYDEIIFFYHNYQIKRKFEMIEKSKENLEFPLLVNNEFILGNKDSAPIESDKILNEMNNKEILQTVITRVKQFSVNDDIIFKELFLDNLTTYSERIGFENAVDIIIPVLSKIADDVDSIKIKFLKVFPQFFEFLSSNLNKSYNVITGIFNLIIDIYSDKSDQEITQLVCKCFILIAKILNAEDKGTLILSTLLGWANEEGEENMRIESRSLATKLFGELSECLGKDYTEQFIIPQLNFLADDPHFKVRKSVTVNLINCSKLVNYNIFLNKVMPIYKNLSQDVLWTVRKSCVEILPQMMKLIKEKSNYTSKNEEFIKLFNLFIYDSQKYVRSAAIEIFGSFISELEKEELDEKYLNFYKNTLEQIFFNVKDFGIETESNYYNNIIYHCAYNFPSVLYCYGKSYWDKLKDVYSNLANDKNDFVKRTIISSFHEIAKIIGPDLLESDLLTIYDSFLLCKNEEVKDFALSNLPLLMKLMKIETRIKYLKYLPIYNLEDIDKNSFSNKNKYDWRLKIEILEKYSKYFDLFDYEIIWNKILPMCIQLCFDNVIFFIFKILGFLCQKEKCKNYFFNFKNFIRNL